MDEIKIIQDSTTPNGERILYAETSRTVCARRIGVAVKDGIILEAAFDGGCSGNTQGVATLVAGMKVEDAISRLEGIKCGAKSTSCPDQLSKLLKATLSL